MLRRQHAEPHLLGVAGGARTGVGRFRPDPEWIKARKDSIDRSGQMVAFNEIAIYRAMAYFPMK